MNIKDYADHLGEVSAEIKELIKTKREGFELLQLAANAILRKLIKTDLNLVEYYEGLTMDSAGDIYCGKHGAAPIAKLSADGSYSLCTEDIAN